MPTIETGHEDNLGLTLTLSDAFLESLSAEQLQGYLSTIEEGARVADSMTEDELAGWLRDRLDAHGVALPELSYGRTAEQLRTADGVVSVTTNDGKVLLGKPDAAAPDAVPDVHGTEDPADPDRPFYS